MVRIVSKTRFPIGLVLSSLLVSSMTTFWLLKFAFSNSEKNGFTIMFCIFVGYLLFLIRFFVVNEGRKYSVSAFSISALLSTIACGIYTTRVGGWFWNDDYVLEDALLASIAPVIILLLVNELFGMVERTGKGTGDNGQEYVSSLMRIGLVASLPLCVAWGTGVIILVPTLILFFIFYWASTNAFLSLNGN